MRDPMQPAFAFSPPLRAVRLELTLRTRDGEDWLLSLSPGMERFVGAYPRLPEFDVGAPLIAFRAVAAAD
jgi:hypothetical protein